MDMTESCWDPWSASLYLIVRNAVLRMRGDELELVAGSIEEEGDEDGEGAAARFAQPRAIAADGAGSLLLVDSRGHDQIRRLQLPAAWQCAGVVAAAAGSGAAAAVSRSSNTDRAMAGTNAGTVAAGGAAAGVIMVTTMLTNVGSMLLCVSRAPPPPQQQEQPPAVAAAAGKRGASSSSCSSGSGSAG
ncbi:hypothetical protein CHLRE_12g532867v5 [Chlamydomonas reinhardtii]|uniref:Uncharacterized protein n=1 Tax=Chlamydomonas reinhardtii TaxID=3055 RepID=A0A2K3D4X8_CHLRE|nr:uncharacterized protein CHLRE_12g532867v5 [Chlamydomonas reinhardtii]XP_042918691.1 uncharacterized protein CHLRE_12g532867v5 [Chlamydomonas reinhardtii]PNW75590.1 hypothetical protein CHLRE_12g532867v5 [Chlamydomonas reinhardtii]PNW75591.1 hypothetical protein CHLRE_12g532867v5 [Chlamydomonas reinhardtii]